jgi:hypothetical protein
MPIIIEGDDPRVFQANDKLGFGVKPAEEVGVGSIVRSDDLKRNLSLNTRLYGAIHNPKRTGAQLFLEHIASVPRQHGGFRMCGGRVVLRRMGDSGVLSAPCPLH